jgi:hypothetical protein
VSTLLAAPRILRPRGAGEALGEPATSRNVERRATIRLVSYWLSLRRTAAGPWLADLKPERNPIPWDRCSLAFVDPSGQIAWEHFGAEYARVFAMVAADMPVSDSAGGRFATMFGRVADALASSRPSNRDGRYERADGRDVLYRSVMLPFIDGGGRPAYVLTAFSYGLRPLASGVAES